MVLGQEETQQLTEMFANALREAVSQATRTAVASISQQQNTNAQATASSKPPPFTISEFKSTDTSSVEDYFQRFDLALKLSKVSNDDHHTYARVHMGVQLNDALRILIHPKDPQNCSYEEMKNILIAHFDKKRNKFSESIKFRRIIQEKDESIADFTLRLRKAAKNCEYGAFLDRMLTEQLLLGMESRSACDEIIAKNPTTFNEAYEIAHSLEVTRQTTTDMKTQVQELVEPTNKLGYAPAQFKRKPAQSGVKETRSETSLTCYGCGGKHLRNLCKFRSAKCFSCGKSGHIARVCKAATAQVTEERPDEMYDSVQCLNSVNVVKNKSIGKKIIRVVINGCDVDMELDTGAPCGIISKKTLQKIKPVDRLLKTDRQFSSYTGHKIPCIGRVPVDVKVRAKNRRLNLYVVDGNFESLFGREWISHFVDEIDIGELFTDADQVNSVKVATPTLTEEQNLALLQLLRKYEDIFSESAGKLKGPPAKLHLKPGSTPVFTRARDIPLALRDAYAAEIDSKIRAGLFEKVEYSEWASSTHVVTKKNGKIRITGNYKPTLNPRMIIDEHPIPKVEMILNKMDNAKLFCHLDITDAYSHLTITDEFAHALTLNTPTHGLIRPKRAVYGAANIPAIWQRRMESVLQGVPNVSSFFDDILVHAVNFDEMISNLQITLERLKDSGLRLNKSKCVFAAPAVEFLGHKIDGNGIHKSDKHIEAIRDAPRPTTMEELQLFLGKASYYNSFIPNLSTRSRPLRNILVQDTFVWTPEADQAYDDIKNALISPEVLIPYDPKLPLLLATDASQVGLGAVLSHRLHNGQERPIAYASRTLTATERKYPQMDKEALAIIWAVQKFFLYLYARHWTLITDHKPLSQILHPDKSLPVLCISRMANYADYLSNFDFDIVFKPTKSNLNADFCSRMIKPDSVTRLYESRVDQYQLLEGDGFDNFMIKQIQQLPVKSYQIANETRKDARLGEIVRLLESGKCLRKCGYKAPEANYKQTGGCLVFDHRVVIPSSLQKRILMDLHSAHLGIVKMKGLARSFVYWPGLDSDIEQVANTCVDCSKYANNPPKFKEHHWDYPKGPWERIHIDYAGPFLGTMFLVITDAFSKWIEVKLTRSTTANATISILDELFSTYGVPITIVSDNGTNFTSMEFKNFLQNVGVKYHKLTAPYHPSTNGQAERSVRTIKDALKSMDTNKNDIQSNLNEFLRQYRNAPHSTTGQSPAQLFFGRSLRTRLDLIFPQEVSTLVTQKQYMKFDANFRNFNTEDNVWFRSENPRMDKWVQGTILHRLGDLHYHIAYNGKLYKRHIDQIRKVAREEKEPQEEGTDRRRQWDNNRYSHNGRDENEESRFIHYYPKDSVTENSTDDPMHRDRTPLVRTQLCAHPRAPPIDNTMGNSCSTDSLTPPGRNPVCAQPKTPVRAQSTTEQLLRRSTRMKRQRLVYSP